MRELVRFIEPPRTCSYLPRETESLEIRAIEEMDSFEYGDLLARGYRRFGWQVFRPACAACTQCRSLRIVTSEFKPTASERRILRKNAGIRAVLQPLYVTREHIELYNRYHEFMRGHRHWPQRITDPQEYAESFLVSSGTFGFQWLYMDGDRLVGVSLMDEVPGAISLIYAFYDPDWRPLSPGTFSILNQLQYARERGLRYAYLGYWVEACESLSYKGRFRPREVLREHPDDGVEPVWERLE